MKFVMLFSIRWRHEISVKFVVLCHWQCVDMCAHGPLCFCPFLVFLSQLGCALDDPPAAQLWTPDVLPQLMSSLSMCTMQKEGKTARNVNVVPKECSRMSQQSVGG